MIFFKKYMHRYIIVFIIYILLNYCIHYYIKIKTTINIINNNKKYLTYLPHSGFHNQRIEMENALLLSYILNRTLLLSKANLDTPTPWESFDDLNKTLNKQNINKLFSWNTFFNMNIISDHIDFIEINKISDIYKYGDFKDMFIIKDKFRYDYQIDNNNEIYSQNYNKSIYIEKLHKIDKKILHFGSLFGSERISDKLKNNTIQNIIYNTTILYNKEFNKITNYIVDKINNQYISIHIRVGDSFYKNNKVNTIKKTIEILKKQNISYDEIIYIATDIKNPRTDNDFNYFYKYFPNTYTINDFDINVENNFIPFIDILVCSKSKKYYYALPNSTFSKYIEKIWKVNNYLY